MATSEDILGLLKGHISDGLLETVRLELIATKTQAKSAKRQRIYEYLDAESDGETIAEEYPKFRQEAAKQAWRATTETRLLELSKQLRFIDKDYTFKVEHEGRSQVINAIDCLVREWNASMGPRCTICGDILKIHVNQCWWFRQHTPQPSGDCIEGWCCDKTK